MTSPITSIIIPTRDRPKKLQKCLQSLIAQTHNQLVRIIVVDDCSTDSKSVQSVIRNLDHGVIYIHIRRGGPSITRMVGVKFAHPKSEFIIFIDDDCIADKAFIQSSISFLSETPYAGAGGKVKSIDGNGILKKYHTVRPTMIRPRYFPDGRVKHIYTCNSVFRYNVLQEVGVINPIDLLLNECGYILRGGEDSDLSERIINYNYLLGYCPNMIVYHDHRTKFLPFLRQNFGYGRGLYLRRYSAEIDYRASNVTRKPKTVGQIILTVARNIPYRLKKIYGSSIKFYRPKIAAVLSIIEIMRFCMFWSGVLAAIIEYKFFMKRSGKHNEK